MVMTIHTTQQRAAVLCAVLLVAGLGLTGCGDDEQPQPTVTSSDEQASESAPAESGDASSAPTSLDGEPLPEDWPANFLVPYGTIKLIIPNGTATGYMILVEGVDDEQARGLIADMVGAGLTEVSAIAESGSGEWNAIVSDGVHQASYAYATGGAGEPNVTIHLDPAPQ